ncbi:EH domain-containing protein 1 [Tanacetum coccineum]
MFRMDLMSIPGNTVGIQEDMPFNGLTIFGSAFLSKFQHSQMAHPLLEYITFVDTPGVLSGENQRTKRSCAFTGVTSWFVAKCDLILLLFDPHKLDISDEFKCVMSSLRGLDDKIRVVLNKADQVETQGVWSTIAFVVPWTELFEKEQDDLLSNLKDIPKKSDQSVCGMCSSWIDKAKTQDRLIDILFEKDFLDVDAYR